MVRDGKRWIRLKVKIEGGGRGECGYEGEEEDTEIENKILMKKTQYEEIGKTKEDGVGEERRKI